MGKTLAKTEQVIELAFCAGNGAANDTENPAGCFDYGYQNAFYGRSGTEPDCCPGNTGC